MAVDNPQVVKFCNEGLRTTANKLADAYYAAKALCEAFDATGIASLLPDDAESKEVIQDNSASDGRPQISAGGVALTIANIKALLEQLETTKTPSGLSLVQGILSISPRYNG